MILAFMLTIGWLLIGITIFTILILKEDCTLYKEFLQEKILINYLIRFTLLGILSIFAYYFIINADKYIDIRNEDD